MMRRWPNDLEIVPPVPNWCAIVVTSTTRVSMPAGRRADLTNSGSQILFVDDVAADDGVDRALEKVKARVVAHPSLAANARQPARRRTACRQSMGPSSRSVRSGDFS